MSSCAHTGGRSEDNAVIHEKTRGVLFASNEYFKSICYRDVPSKRNQVHQQRAPDLCGPTFQLITGYTSCLTSYLREFFFVKLCQEV